MDIQEAKFLYSEHGELCLVGDDEDATVITVSKNNVGNFVVEFINENNDTFFKAFSTFDEAIFELDSALSDVDCNFEFVY